MESLKEINKLTQIIIGEAIEVHKKLSPGLLESAYHACLFYAIQQRGLNVIKEKEMPVRFRDITLNCAYRIDLLVEDKIIVELKAVEELNNINMAQVMSYLKMGNFKLGLLINFNVKYLKQVLKLIIN